MGKGIKMRAAKDCRGHLHTVKELQKLVDGGGKAPPLYCEICGCSVTFVRRYPRENTTEVREHIRLVQSFEHAESCDYNVSGRLNFIAANSDPDFLKEIGEGKRELRLLILHNDLNGNKLLDERKTSENISISKNGIEVTTSRINKLDSYLRTASDIIKLRAVCEDDDSLANKLVLSFGNVKIRWKDFFFEADRLDDAWKIIKNNKQPYPVALIGRVKNLKLADKFQFLNCHFLNCHSQFYKADGSHRIPAFEISLKHRDASFFDGFVSGTGIVMFGIWRAYDPKSNPSSGKIYVNHKLMLAPKHKQQIVIVPQLGQKEGVILD